jgi:signal transduction histidine kinase
MIFVKVILPMRMKFFEEKQNILLEQAKLMALFSELDPDPSLRCNLDGEIIQTNEASRILFGIGELKGKNINQLLNNLNKNISELISENKEHTFIEEIRGKIFLVNVRGNENYGFAHIYMNDITKLKEYETELEDYKEKLRTLADRLESRFEKQRKQLSSELHDDIGQKMVLLKMKLNQLFATDEKGLFNDVEQIYARIRDISHLLKPAEIDELGLKYSVQMLVNKVTADSNLEGYFAFLGEDEKFNPEIELCLYRIIQEALTNILKHAEANEFSVQLVNKEEQIELFISDDGKGIPKEYFESKDLKNYGIGLFGMREKLSNFNGAIKINSAPNEGTSIIIKIPKNSNGHEQN